MIEFTVDAALSGQRPDRALRAVAPAVDRDLALKLLRTGRILVNGKPADLRMTVKEGDKVRAKMDERRAMGKPRVLSGAQPTPYGLGLIYQDEHICLVDKPSGMATHPGTGAEHGATLTELVARMLEEQGHPPEVAPAAAGRLDRGTSGIVVLSLSRAAEPTLGRAYQEGSVKKQYLALCQGVTAERFEVDAPLVVTRYVPSPDGGHKHKKLKKAHTRFERVAQSATASLVRVFPETGRTHQIRRHLKKAGHPVVGDERYGLPGRQWAAAAHLCLHMHHLVLAHPVTGQSLDVTVSPPPGFLEAMERAGIPRGVLR